MAGPIKEFLMPPPQTHLSELLLESRLHQPADAFRSRRAFSPDMEAVRGILFNPKYDRQAKIRAYRGWLEKNQPCVFGNGDAYTESASRSARQPVRVREAGSSQR